MTTVCITGMHRAGTSMVARLLNLCGLNLGPEQDIMPPAPDNPEGFWENVRFVHINEGILSAFGGAWDLPPDFPPGWASSERLLPLRHHAMKLIAEFAPEPTWGWKDPRSSLTLPFWRELLPDLKVIVIVRNPLDIFHSLTNRGFSSFAFNIRLIRAYYAGLQQVEDTERQMVSHYDAYFPDPRPELKRLLHFLGIVASSESIEEAVAGLNPGLRHAQSSLEALLSVGAPSDVIDDYIRFCEQAGSNYRESFETQLREAALTPALGDRSISLQEDGSRVARLTSILQSDSALPGVNELAARKQLEIAQLQAQVLLNNQQLSAKDSVLQKLSDQLSDKDTALQKLSEQLSDKDSVVQKLSEQLSDKTSVLQKLSEQLSDKDRQLGEKETALVALWQEMEQITTSTSWKAVTLVGRLRTRLAPAGTWRARIVKRLIGSLKSLGRILLGRSQGVVAATAQESQSLQYAIESEIPHSIVAGKGNFISISGWCFHPDAPIRTLSFRIAGKQHRVRNVGFARRDIWKHFGGVRSLRSGFWGLVPVTPLPSPEEAKLEMVVEIPNRPDVLIELGVVEILPDLPVQRIDIDKGRRDEPLVAICLVTRNPDLRLFRLQIASFQAQTHRNWICLVQDDESDQARYEDMRRLLHHDDRFVVDRNESRLGGARTLENALARLPDQIDFVAICDQEWTWGREVLTDSLHALRSEQVQLVFHRSNIEGPRTDGAPPSSGTCPSTKYRSLEAVLFSNEVEEPVAAFRGSLLRHLLPFPSGLGDQQHGFWLASVALALGEVRCQASADSAAGPDAWELPSQGLLPELGMLPRWLRSRGTFRHEAGTILLGLERHYHDYLTHLILFARLLDLRLENVSPAKRSSLRSIASAEYRASGLIGQALKYALSHRPTSGHEYLALRSYLAHRALAAHARWGRERRPRELQSPAAMMNPAQQGVSPATEIIDASVNLLRMGTAPIPLIANRHEPPRVNVLMATINFQYVFGGYLAMFHLAQKMAQTGRRVRIVLVEPTAFNPEEWRSKILGYPGLEQLFDNVEVSYNYDRSIPLAVNPDDAFVATSCWTAHIASRTARQLGHRKIVFLAQEYEPLFFNASSFKAISDASYSVPQFTIFSTDLLREYFQLHAIGIYARDKAYGDRHSLVFNNAINTFHVSLRSLQARQKRRLLFYARPEQHAARNMFELGILGLSEALRLDYLDPDEWEFYGIGTAGRTARVPLHGDASLTLLPKVNLKEYRETLPSFDVGLSLMLSPHPSLVPIEMAAAGMVTVTNTCENKTAERLAAISTNLVAFPPTVDGIAEGLRQAARQVVDYEARLHGSRVNWATDWGQAFNPEFMHRLEDFLSDASHPDGNAPSREPDSPRLREAR